MQRSDGIYSFKYKPFLIPFLVLLLSIVSYYPAFAQSEEEMKMLQMYFKKDELVVSATRTYKPISQVAENISIVTAKEIEAMNAHTIDDVLSRVTGVFVVFRGNDFGGDSETLIQGALSERHILVLLDGIPWNDVSGGDVSTNIIPVGIIKRIEVIKGPASSAWGSSLGGVVNVITKDTGDTVNPSGSVTVSLGERDTQDHSADITGKAGRAGYYIHVNRQESDGLRDNRFMERDSLYGKIKIDIMPDVDFTLSAGYSDHYSNPGDTTTFDLTSSSIIRKYFATANLSAALTRNIHFDVSLFTSKQEFYQDNDELISGDPYLDNDNEEEFDGASVKINLKNDVHNAVLGIDYGDYNFKQTLTAGPYLQSLGVPQRADYAPGLEKWAVFINDTISMGDLTITPGIRFDHNNADGDFTSPSIGATYILGKRTVVRATAAKGFATPPIIFSKGGGLFLDPNPDLKPEKVLSYQAGIESWLHESVKAKLTLFHHDMKEVLVKELYAGGAPAFNDLYFNKAEIKRDGIDAEVETTPINNISFKNGFTYVHTRKYFDEATSEDIYAYNAAVKYDDNIFRAFIDGRYVWWDYPSTETGKYDAFIVDVSLAKTFPLTGKVTPEIFFSAHNIFNSSYYTFADRKNPGRWIEAGLKLRF